MLFTACSAGAQDETALETFVRGESGFPGAVSIVERGQTEGLEYVTAAIPYRDVYGGSKRGLARLYVQKDALSENALLPPFVHVHYEKPAGGARKWCRRGWVVVTPYFDTKGGMPIEISIGDSNNLNRAIIEWVRRLPLVDRTKLHIDGASQGGYMTLAMAAEFFPVSAVTPDAPVVNWAYNLNYFEANKDVTGYGVVDPKKSPLPVMAMVSELADIHLKSVPVPSAYYLFGGDLGADAYYRVSPISYLERITCPVLMQCATGDMLVPTEQITDRYTDELPEGVFPKGYKRGFESLTLNDKARTLFVEALPKQSVQFAVMERDEAAWEFSRAFALGEEKPPKDRQRNRARPWNPGVQWNIVVYDEGPPLPHSLHTRYQWRTSNDDFIEAHRKRHPAVSSLTAAKLARLLERYSGELSGLPELTNGEPANRLNFPKLEQLDVVTGLIDYAELSEAHQGKLVELYAAGASKPFGGKLSIENLRSLRQELLGELGLP